MEEDGQTGRKRHQLKAEKVKLDQAIASINELEEKYSRAALPTVGETHSFLHSDMGTESIMDLDEMESAGV